MKFPVFRQSGLLCVLCASLLWPSSAWATAHTYVVNEIFSNASGTIQFVELREDLGFDFQNVFTNRALASNSITQVLSTDLPSTATANTMVLFGTTDFAALPGAPTPDYILPDGFVAVAGDTIEFCPNATCSVPAPFDSLTFVSLPTDGVTSIGPGAVTALNSPTNFAGVSGSVDASGSPGVPGLGEASTVLLLVILLVGGGTMLRASKRMDAVR